VISLLKAFHAINLKQRNAKYLKVQTVDRAFNLVKSFSGNMSVYFRCFGTAVSEQALDVAQVGALLQQVRGKRLAQGMDGCTLVDGCFGKRLFEYVLDAAGGILFATSTFKQPYFGLIRGEVLTQDAEQACRQQYQPVFCSLALAYFYLHPLGVNIRNFQVNQLA